ncbi:MAG: hypothetical protein GF307_04435 [candidate division Zixibacteria bacterium]|nr:hypothetical protein [candidate division Zixibacteria bacterium]
MEYRQSRTRSPLFKVILAGLFAALAIALNYLLIYIPNVKLFNLVIFVAGLFGGIYAGILSGAVASAIYSIFNPYNAGTFPPLPMLFAQIFCMALIGAAGGLTARLRIFETGALIIALKAGAIGAVLAILYNMIVTAAGAYLFGALKEAFVVGIPFMAINVGVNTIIFAVLMPLIVPVKYRLNL